jgi:hypothetical protein
MGYGVIDPEDGIREGWVRDSNDEIGMDGYNAFIAITTNDGTGGMSVINSDGSTTFRAKSNGDAYVARRLGVNTYNPSTELEVIGQTKTDGFKMPTDAHADYVMTSDSTGTGTWKPSTGGTGNMPAPRCCGQVLYALNTDKFTAETPLTSKTAGWLMNNDGTLLVVG